MLLAMSDRDLAAVTTICGCVVTVITTLSAVFALWVKVKYGIAEAKDAASAAATKAARVETKMDINTSITRAGAAKAADAAEAAERGRLAAASASEQVEKKLNGGLDAALITALRPIHEALVDMCLRHDEHVKKDEENMVVISNKLADLSKRIK